MSTCHCILPPSADPPCILGTLHRQEMKSCNVSWGCCGNQVAVQESALFNFFCTPPALFRQFNSSTPDALLCTALASSGKGGQEARRAFAQVSHCTHSHTAHCLFACFTLQVHSAHCKLHTALHAAHLHTAHLLRVSHCTPVFSVQCVQCVQCAVCSAQGVTLHAAHLHTAHTHTAHLLRVSHCMLNTANWHTARRMLHICTGYHTARHLHLQGLL